MFPDNILEACFRQVKTRYKETPMEELASSDVFNGTNATLIGSGM